MLLDSNWVCDGLKPITTFLDRCAHTRDHVDDRTGGNVSLEALGISMRMFRVLLFGCGVILMLASGLLALRSFAGQGINDGEWGNIAKTGVPLCMEQLRWSSWRRNDGSVYPFSA